MRRVFYSSHTRLMFTNHSSLLFTNDHPIIYQRLQPIVYQRLRPIVYQRPAYCLPTPPADCLPYVNMAYCLQAITISTTVVFVAVSSTHLQCRSCDARVVNTRGY